MAKKDAYTTLWNLSKHGTVLCSVNRLLEWDQETYLPHGAIENRSLQIETLATLIHKEYTSARFSKALDKLISIETGDIREPQLSDPQKAALREWRRDHLTMIKLPTSFVRTFAQTTSKAIHAWAEAKKKNNFRLFVPFLEKIISLSRKKADYLGFEDHPYDALLDLFEPGVKTAYLTPLFGKLKIGLTELIKTVTNTQQPPQDFLHGDFPAAKQMHFAHELLRAMGFDPLTSRLDQSAHPFCTDMHPRDVRMTTHIHPDSPLPNIFAVIHEGGHGLYHKNLPAEHYGSPLAESASLGIDESQSRFWETFIGHSFPFWQYFYPKLQALFPEKLQQVTLEKFYHAINRVKPSFIRIQSDEVTYSLHIILRFEIEKALIEGTLKPKEIPEIWNEKMRDYFGITPPDFALGCLQDIHWSMGAIGYFPTYTLGNLYAAQFLGAFEKAHPDWHAKVAAGQLHFIEKWLAEHIHHHGRRFTPSELIQRLTGTPLSEKPYLAYLNKKFTHPK